MLFGFPENGETQNGNNKPQRNKDIKDDLGDRCRTCSNAGKSEDTSDYGDNKEDHSPS